MNSIFKKLAFYTFSFVMLIYMNGFVNYSDVLFESERNIFQSHGIKYEIAENDFDIDKTYAEFMVCSLNITNMLTTPSGAAELSGKHFMDGFNLNLSDIVVHKSVAVKKNF